MGKKDTHVKHEGTITQIDGTTVYVRIIQHSACAGCHVQSACTAADRSEKIIETTCYIPDLYVGQQVWVVGNEAMSNEALRLAFLYPFSHLLRIGRYLFTHRRRSRLGHHCPSFFTALLSDLVFIQKKNKKIACFYS